MVIVLPFGVLLCLSILSFFCLVCLSACPFYFESNMGYHIQKSVLSFFFWAMGKINAKCVQCNGHFAMFVLHRSKPMRDKGAYWCT